MHRRAEESELASVYTRTAAQWPCADAACISSWWPLVSSLLHFSESVIMSAFFAGPGFGRRASASFKLGLFSTFVS